MILGEMIREGRTQNGLTLRQAEAATGISNAYLSQLETGKVKAPMPDKLRAIAIAYGMDYQSLMDAAGWFPPPSVVPPNVQAIACWMCRRDTEHKPSKSAVDTWDCVECGRSYSNRRA